MVSVDQLALVAPLKDHPGYFISPDGPVYSNLSGELRPLKIRQTRRGRVYVHVYDAAGKRHCLGIRKLLDETFMKDENDEAESAVGDGG